MKDFSALIAAQTIEVGDCLEWQGAFGRGQKSKHTPIIRHRINGKHADLIVAREVWRAAHGEVPAGKIVYRGKCSNDKCVLLDHLRLGKRGDQLRAKARNLGANHLQSTRAAMTSSARCRSTTKYSIEHARAVRDLVAAGVPDILIAGATDMNPCSVADIRLGRSWTEQQGPASVFSWRPAGRIRREVAA